MDKREINFNSTKVQFGVTLRMSLKQALKYFNSTKVQFGGPNCNHYNP